MNAPPDRQLLETIATELGVDPSFVEKDWHAMRLVAVLAGVKHGELRPVFSGGTSLSKAYGLIRRFSEDLDFKLVLPEESIGRAARSEYRRLVIDAIRDAGDCSIKDSTILVGNQSRYFIPSVIKNDRWAFTRHAGYPRFAAGARSRGPSGPRVKLKDPWYQLLDRLSRRL